MRVSLQYQALVNLRVPFGSFCGYRRQPHNGSSVHTRIRENGPLLCVQSAPQNRGEADRPASRPRPSDVLASPPAPLPLTLSPSPVWLAPIPMKTTGLEVRESEPAGTRVPETARCPGHAARLPGERPALRQLVARPQLDPSRGQVALRRRRRATYRSGESSGEGRADRLVVRVPPTFSRDPPPPTPDPVPVPGWLAPIPMKTTGLEVRSRSRRGRACGDRPVPGPRRPPPGRTPRPPAVGRPASARPLTRTGGASSAATSDLPIG